MSDYPITNAQLREALADLKEYVRERFDVVDVQFDGVKDRLDRVNGRLDKHDDVLDKAVPAIAAHNVSINNLNHEVFTKRRSASPAVPKPDGESFHVSGQISPKLWAAIYMAGGAIGALLVEWLRRTVLAP